MEQIQTAMRQCMTGGLSCLTADMGKAVETDGTGAEGLGI